MTFLQEMEQNADEIRRLLGVQTAGEIALQFTAITVSLARELVSLTQTIALAQTPVGAIIAWHKNLTPNPAPLSDHWLACNGQTVNDTASPFHGLTLPSLNTTNLFLRGATASGGTGGTTSHSHTFSGVTDITADVAGAPAGTDNPLTLETHTHAFSGTTDNTSTLPPHFEVVWIIRIK
jgi:hypothetical protein